MRKAVLHKLDTILELLVERRLLITMVPLAKATHTFSGGQELADAILEVTRHDFENQRPLRASIIVSKTRTPPRPYLQAIHKYFSVSDELQFWHDQLRALGYDPRDLHILGIDDEARLARKL